MTSICLINPPQPYLIDPKTNPPLGLMYLASFMRKMDHDVKIIDLADKYDDMMNSRIIYQKADI